MLSHSSRQKLVMGESIPRKHIANERVMYSGGLESCHEIMNEENEKG